LVVVHGAGSFGHLKARRWKLDKGDVGLAVLKDADEFGIRSQEQAVRSVQEDMKSLNRIVVSALEKQGLDCVVRCPHECGITGVGCGFRGNVTNLFQDTIKEREIAVTFGDVVLCEDDKKFGILSGDDLIYRISTEISNVDCVVFAIDGVDGLLASPPKEGVKQQLIPVWKPGDNFIGEHNNEIDVTGGIFLKLRRGAQINKHGPRVTLVRGIPERFKLACKSLECIGTTISN